MPMDGRNDRGTARICGRAILGGLLVGAVDIADALLFWGVQGVPGTRVLAAIASGVLGPAAFEGGAGMAWLGLALHFAIALVIVALYVAAAARWPSLRRPVLLWGTLYGLVVYGVMNYVVVPLSAAPLQPPTGAAMVNGLLIHVVGVGWPTVLMARWALAARASSAP